MRCFVDRPQRAYDLLREAAERNPDGEALVCNDVRMTYRQFERAVECFASGLSREGIKAGDRVAMLLRNSLLFPILTFACLLN